MDYVSFAMGLSMSVVLLPFAIKQFKWTQALKRYRKKGMVAVEVLEKSGTRTRTFIKPNSTFIKIKGYSGRYLISGMRHIMDTTLNLPVFRYTQENSHEIDFLRKTRNIDLDSEDNKDIKTIKHQIKKLEVEINVKEELVKKFSDELKAANPINEELEKLHLKLDELKLNELECKENSTMIETYVSQIEDINKKIIEKTKLLEKYLKFEAEITILNSEIKDMRILKLDYERKLDMEIESFKELKEDLEQAIENLLNPNVLELLTIQERKKGSGLGLDAKKIMIIIGALVFVGYIAMNGI